MAQMESHTFRCGDGVWQELRALATLKDRTTSELVRMSVEATLARHRTIDGTLSADPVLPR